MTDRIAVFMSKVRQQPDGCWKWFGPLTRGTHGHYGQINVDGQRYKAHRLAWLLFRGPIPDGFHMDHLCRNTRCVNPDHLEPVTQRENNLRSLSPAASNARKTHCIRGHEFTLDNLIIRRNGSRQCRACTNLRARERRARA